MNLTIFKVVYLQIRWAHFTEVSVKGYWSSSDKPAWVHLTKTVDITAIIMQLWNSHESYCISQEKSVSRGVTISQADVVDAGTFQDLLYNVRRQAWYVTKNTGSANQKGPDQLLRSSWSCAAAGSMTDAQLHCMSPQGSVIFLCVSPPAKFIHKYRVHLLRGFWRLQRPAENARWFVYRRSNQQWEWKGKKVN